MAPNTRSALAAPLAICCLVVILLLIASTIVLALIPVYLSTRDVDVDTSDQQEALTTGYASNAVGARSDTLTNIPSLSTQLVNGAGVSSDNLALNAGSFPSLTAASRKRQTINSDGTVTCEKSTGLTGDIFQANYIITYPITCLSVGCRNRYKTKLTNALRDNYQTMTVTMNFTIAGVKSVKLVFCGVFSQSSTGCTTETKKYAYLLDINYILYQFEPISMAVTKIGTINCTNSSIINGIALQRNGILWATFLDGTLYRYNIKSAQCTPTNFVGNQSNIAPYTMTFLKNSNNSNETLYATQQVYTNASLATINTNTYTLSVVGQYNNLFTYADLAGTNDGRLFGLFDVRPYTIARINPTNAQILAQYPLNVTSLYDPSYGFTVYNTKFYFFLSNDYGNSSDLYTYDLSSNTTTYQKTISQVFFSATSSSCLGTS